MRVVPDNTHCLKHALSYPMDEQCPYCRIATLEGRVTALENKGRKLGPQPWQPDMTEVESIVGQLTAEEGALVACGIRVRPPKWEDADCSGRGYGGGQGVSSQGPSSPFD